MQIQKSKKSLFLGILVGTIVVSTLLLSHGARAVTCTGNFTEYAGVCFPSNTGLSEKPVADILGNLMDWLLGIFTVLAVMAFVVSGLQYITSTGDEGMIDTAKMNMKWSAVGVIVGLSGFLMLQAVQAMLNGTSQTF